MYVQTLRKESQKLKRGRKQVLEVGNLESIRDVTDVRDAVKALWLLSKKGQFGEAYNLCSGNGYKINDILNKLIFIIQIK